MKLPVIILVALSSINCSMNAQERITQFISDITVQVNGTVAVTETITVNAQSNAIKRGIVREIPTRYKDRWGNNIVVDLGVNSVLRDGKQESYHLQDAVN